MDPIEIDLLEGLLQDEDLDRLEPLAEAFNVFEVLGAVKQEARHSNFLAWLLDPTGNHGLGDYFVKRFLWRTASLAKEQGIPSPSQIDIDALDLAKLTVQTEWRGVDILLRTHENDFVCAIENKVESGEHGDQLARYATECGDEFPRATSHLVFLSALQMRASHDAWVSAGYDLIVELVEAALQAKKESIGDDVRLFLRHYIGMLRRHVVNESEIGELCQRIYSRHRRALDLLFEYRPDTQSEVRKILEEVISEDSALELSERSSKAYIHFAPRVWSSPQLRNAGAGGSRVLTFMFQNRPSDLALFLEIQPGEPAVREQIYAAAKSSSVLKPPSKLYPQFSRIFKRNFLGKKDYEEPLEPQIRHRMEGFKKNDLPKIIKDIEAIQFS